MAGEWDVVGERAAPKTGGGEWDVVGEAPFQPAQQKRQVGAGEAFVDDLKAGSSKIGRDVIAAVGSPLLAVDAAANKLVGHETGASEWWAENVFGPYQRFVDNAAAKRSDTQRSIPVELAGAAGGLVTSTPEMIAGSKAAQAMKVAEGIPALGQLLTRAFAAAQPMSARAGADRFADVKAMGADDLTAANAALGTYANTTAQGMAPMGAPGGIVKRAVTGAAVNPVMAAAGRSAENAINSTSGDPRLQQQVVSPEQAVVDAVMGAGMHGVIGEKGRASQSPEAVAADRTNWNNSHDAETVMANRTVTPDAAPLADIIAAATGAKNRPESVAEWQQQQQAERAATAQRANELRSTFKGVDLPKDPAVPATKEQAVRQAYEEQGIDPDSTLTAIKRGYAADGMDLPPTVREGVAKENSDALARQAFALADRRQKQADADLANNGQLAHDYQGGASAAHGGELDSGIRRVTLLDGEVPVEIVAHDGKTATVSIEQNGKTIEFDVPAKRLTEHDLPANQRLAQDYRARSSEPARGVGVETMAGEKMPRRSTDRIAGDEIGGLTTPYDPRQKDGGRVEGDVLQPAAGKDIAPRAGARQGDTINGTASRQTAGFEPQNSQRQIGERRALEDRNRFTVDAQGRSVDRENRVSGVEGQPLHGEKAAGSTLESPRSAEQQPPNGDVPPHKESVPESADASREPHQQTAKEWHKQHTEWLLSRFKYSPNEAADARKSPVAWSDHADFLETALENGKTIPSRVLDDYRASGKSFDQAEYPLLSKRLAGGENMPAAGQTQQQQQRLEAKRKADAERDDFTLSGSGRPADENPNQGDIFDGQNKLYDIGGYVGENVVKALKDGLGWAEQKIGRVLHEVTDPVFSTVDGAPSAGLLDYLNRKLADNFSFVEKVQKSVGHEVEEAADAVLAQRLLAGKTGDRLRRFDDDLMAPLKQAVTTASKNKGVTLDDINDFLYARHAGERNRQVASINPGKMDGSGITDAQARETLAKFDKAGKTAALNRIAAEFDKITAFERRALADAGLITRETLANWQRAYKHYAPLKGEESDAAFSHSGGSGGFGSQAKYGRATGRFSQASNLIERAIMNAQVAVIRAEKAEVGRAFLKFAQDNPNKALVTSIDQLPTKAEIRADGSVGYKTDGLAAMSDRVMAVVDRNGASHQIVFANNEAGALLARALNGMGEKEAGVVVRAVSKVSRLYAGLQTKWNPEFVVTNALRDVQTALGTVGSEFGHKMTGKVLADYRKAATAIVANESGGKVDFSSKEWKEWHDRFRAAGGETHFVSVDDVAAGGKILQQAVDAGYSALHPKGAWRRGAEAASRALAVIDVANSAIENALRLSVFKNLVESGHSEAKAAMAAKECTVNFNRHGEAGPAINAMYVFFNATTQGQLVMARIFKNHTKAATQIATAFAGLGGSLAAMNYMASGEDEDGRAFYDKVPTEVKNRWAVMMVPDGVAGTLREYAPGWMIPSEEETAGQLYLKLFPLSPGFGMFANAGAGMVEASRADNADLARSILAKRMLSTVIDSFNPFGSNSVVAQLADGEYSKAAGEFGKLVSPTAFDPFVELGLNSNFMGSAIYKEQDEKSTAPAKPNSEVAFKKTSDTSKAIARWLNSATGGDDLRAGNIDVSADKLDYIAGYVTGGAGRFVMNLGKTIGDAAEGKEPDYKRVPFARLAAGDARGAPYEHFNKAQHEVQLAAKEAGMGRETNEELAALAREEKTVAAFIKQQRVLLSKVQDDAGLSDDEVHERETAINRRIESRMKQFLGRYYEAGGKKLSY